MTGRTLIYIGAALPMLWGISHLFPTRGVVRGFGDISADNRNIIAMEWITEGVALIFLSAGVIAVTLVDATSTVAIALYIVSSACLLVLAIVSLFTGFRINFLPFRLCPLVFTSSAILITIGWTILN